MNLEKSVKDIIKKIYFFFADIIDIILGKRGDMTPLKRKSFYIGRGEYKKIGNDFLKYFTELCSLDKNAKVLDVGCGIGRMAVPLTKYLNKEGAYEGFDIVTHGIEWCRKEITSKYSNFHFQKADIKNSHYNPNGKYMASEYKFPFNDNYFDFAFLTSVFTHMLPQDVENYLREITRVLKKNEKCLITWFILNDESLKHLGAGKSTLDFKYDFNEYRTIDKANKAAAIAFKEEFVKNLYDKCKLKIIEPVHYGSWCGRDQFLSYQDIIIAQKT